MATYSSIQVLSVTAIDSINQMECLNDSDRGSKESLADSEKDVGDQDKDVTQKCLQKSPLPCGSRRSNSTCISVADEESAQEPIICAEEEKDPRSISRQKMCNLMRNMQQTHIAELFPIMESRETTEGSEEQVICRICHAGGDEVLIAPCKCIGSAQFVHATCLLTWFKKSVKNQCELCQHQVPIKKQRKPVAEWKKPEEKPIPIIWFMVFFVGLCLNILSIHVNASESCRSTACLIFYVVNGFGIVLDAAFLWFWWTKCLLYWRKWWAINQDWFITDTSKSYVPMVTYIRKNRSQEMLDTVIKSSEGGDKLTETAMV